MKPLRVSAKSRIVSVCRYTVRNVGEPVVQTESSGGKWVLIARWVSASDNFAFNDVVVKSRPLKTTTTDGANYPVVPSGVINTSDKALLVSGNAAWQSAFGAWQEFDTLADGTVLTNAGITVKTPSGTAQLYHQRSGWPGQPLDMTQVFGFWTVAGNSGGCGGANTVGSVRQCQVLGVGYGSHADLSTVKSLYLKAQ